MLKDIDAESPIIIFLDNLYFNLLGKEKDSAISFCFCLFFTEGSE